MTKHIWCARPRCNERISVPRRKPSRHPKKHRTFRVINPGQGDSLEMGKILRESIAEVDKCAWAADYFGQNGPAFLRPDIVATDAMRSYVAFHPRGVLGSIMPWNFPMWQIVRFAVPALIAGNTVVV